MTLEETVEHTPSEHSVTKVNEVNQPLMLFSCGQCGKTCETRSHIDNHMKGDCLKTLAPTPVAMPTPATSVTSVPTPVISSALTAVSRDTLSNSEMMVVNGSNHILFEGNSSMNGSMDVIAEAENEEQQADLTFQCPKCDFKYLNTETQAGTCGDQDSLKLITEQLTVIMKNLHNISRKIELIEIKYQEPTAPAPFVSEQPAVKQPSRVSVIKSREDYSQTQNIQPAYHSIPHYFPNYQTPEPQPASHSLPMESQGTRKSSRTVYCSEDDPMCPIFNPTKQSRTHNRTYQPSQYQQGGRRTYRSYHPVQQAGRRKYQQEERRPYRPQFTSYQQSQLNRLPLHQSPPHTRWQPDYPGIPPLMSLRPSPPVVLSQEQEAYVRPCQPEQWSVDQSEAESQHVKYNISTSNRFAYLPKNL